MTTRRQALRALNHEINQEAIARTNAIEVGGTYFLSDFFDKAGATVKVLSKSTKRNTAGWNSSVEVEVTENLGADKKHYAKGTKHSVNAGNLYQNREDAAQKTTH